MIFYDRVEELDALASAFESPGSDFFVVYGRRRVGKTELLKEFCADRPHVYLESRRMPTAAAVGGSQVMSGRATYLEIK